MKKILSYFSKGEIILWSCSVATIIISFFIFKERNYLSLAASIIGATALIFCARGNPLGQIFMISFGILYAIISYSFRYYGEMMTYIGMSVPMAFISLISWIRHPFKGNRSEAKINANLKAKDYIIIAVSTLVITVAFYFILKFFGTANLIPSTISVATSFLAVSFTFRRSPLYAIGYALNDIILIILWIMASFKDISYLSVVICFTVFLVNDMHGFFSWTARAKQQKAQENDLTDEISENTAA